MSDGPGDAARDAKSRARAFVLKGWGGRVRQVRDVESCPLKGTVLVVYEEWLDWVVEMVHDRRVVGRWAVRPYRAEIKRLPMTDDWAPGYYRNHELPKE